MYVGYVAMGMWMSQYQEAQYSRVQKVGREPIWGKCGSVRYRCIQCWDWEEVCMGNGRPEFLGNQLSVLISWVCIGTIITCDWWWSFNRQWLWTTVVFKQIGPDRGTYLKVGNWSGINGVLSRSLPSHLPRWKRALLLGKYFQFTGTGFLWTDS